jgi:hypothetical protein
MKKLLAVAGYSLLLVTAVFAAPRYVAVSGAGVGIDSDQSAADQTADSQAQTNLQNTCSAGTLTSPRKIYDQCSQAGDHYVCNVNYTGICKIGD